MRFHKFSLKFGTVICILTILLLILVLNILLESNILIYYITQIRPDDEIDFIELTRGTFCQGVFRGPSTG